MSKKVIEQKLQTKWDNNKKEFYHYLYQKFDDGSELITNNITNEEAYEIRLQEGAYC